MPPARLQTWISTLDCAEARQAGKEENVKSGKPLRRWISTLDCDEVRQEMVPSASAPANLSSLAEASSAPNPTGATERRALPSWISNYSDMIGTSKWRGAAAADGADSKTVSPLPIRLLKRALSGE